MKRRVGARQGGFGLLETLAGLLALTLLILVGTRAYRGVVSNHKEAAQVKALTDAVSETAERLSGLTLAILAGPGSKHLAWSEPAMAGKGPHHYRYRIVPNPKVGGASDTVVVGLEVESGTLEGGTFKASRTFATLIPPNLSARGALGSISTKMERDAEAAFHAALTARIDDLTDRVVPENQRQLNSFSCYDPGQCCGFMREYFADPTLLPEDGMEEKCHYRCALGGDVSIKDWQRSCGVDFCGLAPWRTKQDCCEAIAADACKPGSACARVCIDCVGEDGSTCGPPVCDGWWWNDFFDCKNESFCDGTPLPDGPVEGWGNVKALCRTKECAAVQSECQAKTWICCTEWWGKLNAGETPDPRAAVCANISSQAECCDWEAKIGNFTLFCGSDAKVISARNDQNGQWFCGLNGDGWDNECNFAKGCPAVRRPAGAPGPGCQAWNGPHLPSPWVDPATGNQPPPASGPNVVVVPGPVTGGGGGPVISKDPPGNGGRSGSRRDGDGGELRGGRE